MHHINKTKQTAASGAWLTTDLANKEGEGLLRGGRGLQPNQPAIQTSGELGRSLRFAFQPALPVHGGWLKPARNFGGSFGL